MRGIDYRYAWRNGPRWAGWYIRQRRFVAALRTLWWTLVRGRIGESCQDCGRPYLLWHARDDLYGRVTGRWPKPDGESGGGLFCLACFDRLAEARGIMVIWQPEVYPGTSRIHAEVAELADAAGSNPAGEKSPLRVQLPASAPILDFAAFRVALRAGVAKASRDYSNDEFADFLMGYIGPTVVSMMRHTAQKHRL